MTWTTALLGDVATLDLGKMLDLHKNKGELRPYLANINVRRGTFDLNSLREMRFESRELDRFSLKRGDIVMCEGGEPGRCAIWKDDAEEMMFQKALHRIRPGGLLDSSFLFYAFLHFGKSGGFSQYFTGATIKHLPREQLAKVEVRFPDIDSQRQIAGVLERYDDLIENNRRRIALLEESARLLYREWFVQLRFPGWAEVPVENGKPVTWKQCTFAEVVDAVGGATPSTTRPDFWDGEVIWLTPTDVTRNDCLYLPTSSRKISQAGYEACSATLMPAGTIFMTSRASIGYFALMDQPACTNQGFISVVPKIPHSRNFFLFHLMSRVEEFEAKATGATFKELSKKAFRDLNVLVPDGDVLAAFETAVQPVVDQVINLKKQTVRLTEARDALLPKLMSGEITV